MSDILYLETTAVIDASFKKFPELLLIIKSAEKSLSSHYVKMEIKKGFLYNLVLLHNKLFHCNNWTEVQQFVSNLASSPKRYYLGATLDALKGFFEKIGKNRPTDLIEKYGDFPLDDLLKKDALNFLRAWIKLILPKIDKLVHEIINPMSCFTDLQSPVLIGNLFENRPSTCPESANECEIQKFFRANFDDFKAILLKLREIPDKDRDAETSKRMAALNRILKKRVVHSTLKFSNKSQDENLCWACGDAIHAVLAPRGSSVVNRNERHFNQLCDPIGRKSLVYSSPKV